MDATTNPSELLCESLCGLTLGDYHIERRVGGGATSDVFLATQISLGRRVALKILKSELANDETYVKRFLQEARSAARLEHPNIVRIYEVGELEFSTNLVKGKKKRRGKSVKTYHFIAQEFVGGMSLARYLRRNGKASIMQTFALLEQIASALKRAFEQNIVHRDVKPENVLIDQRGLLKVVDFGLARFTDSADGSSFETTTLTRTGVALGTPLYMSPEQARGQKVDFRSDVYSLGVTAYRALTGVAPFYGETHLAVVLKHLNERPRPIDELRQDVPKGLCDLVMRMLEKDPNNRPSSLSSLLAELRVLRREYLASAQSMETRKIDASRISDFSHDVDAESSSSDVWESSDSSSFSSGYEELGFFQTDEEIEDFNHAMHTTNLSCEWQVNVVQLAKTRQANLRLFSRKSAAVFCTVLGASFFFGVALLLLKNAVVASRDVEPPLIIRRQNTVEEQYVLALQLGTVDAWKSVAQYFPKEKNWTSLALRQLAFSYVEEGNVDEAEKIFNRFAKQTTREKAEYRYGVVGSAWVAASRGSFDQAASLLSDIEPISPFDGLSESTLRKTRSLFQAHYGNESSQLNVFERLTPRGSGEQPFDMRPSP